MPQGTLEVNLINANRLTNNDLTGQMKCYAILTCGPEVQRSALPKLTFDDLDVDGKLQLVWQENFVFNITEGTSELTIKVMDKDLICDDFLGQATISLFPLLFNKDILRLYTYDLIKNDKVIGDLDVSIYFFPDKEEEGSCHE